MRRRLADLMQPRAAALALAAALLSGCATFPPDRFTQCAATLPVVETDWQRGEASTELSVLSYNVEGLPWPARRNRAPRLDEIGRQLAVLRAEGNAPDIVLLQEVFSTAAARITVDSGYENRVRGPGRRAQRPPTSASADSDLVESRKLFKGERLFRLFSSGLYVLSDFPVVESGSQPFRKRECAGFDCLANKGLQHVRIRMPGVPEPIDLFNTHLNAARAARTSPQRSLLAHNLQIDDTARFVEDRRDSRSAMILGGDLNMRHNDARFAHFWQVLPYTLVHQYCAEETSGCAVSLSWDGDYPWRDTQDLQAFEDGRLVTVRPVRVKGMFDVPWQGAPLADHDGVLVVYRLSWPIESSAAPPAPRC